MVREESTVECALILMSEWKTQIPRFLENVIEKFANRTEDSLPSAP
jgi:hypothetical protein